MTELTDRVAFEPSSIGPPIFAADALSMKQAAERWIAERLAIHDEAAELAVENAADLSASFASMSLP
jgi:hypothetical protein